MKVHTRVKRKYALTSSFKHTNFFKGGEATKNGPKTFTTKESADAWAKKQGLKDYTLVPTKKNKKFKVEMN